MKQIKHISWKDINRLSVELAQKIAPFKEDFIGIYGVPRGGLIPAVILSNLTGLPMITSVEAIDNKVLVVDDIIDSGRTAEKMIEKGATTFASLYTSTRASIKPSFYAKIHNDEEWLIFPWETSISSKYDKTLWRA